MSNPYMTMVNQFGRMEAQLNLARFVADLRAEMKGSTRPGSDDSADPRWIKFGLDDVNLTVSKERKRGGDSETVTVTIEPAGCQFRYADVPPGDDFALPKANIHTGRPIGSIAADIKRRVIEPAEAPIAKRREYAALLRQEADKLTQVAARLGERCPGLAVTIRDRIGEFCVKNPVGEFSGGRPYLSGHFYHDGTVKIDRMDSLPWDTFDRLMVALGETKR